MELIFTTCLWGQWCLPTKKSWHSVCSVEGPRRGIMLIYSSPSRQLKEQEGGSETHSKSLKPTSAVTLCLGILDKWLNLSKPLFLLHKMLHMPKPSETMGIKHAEHLPTIRISHNCAQCPESSSACYQICLCACSPALIRL